MFTRLKAVRGCLLFGVAGILVVLSVGYLIIAPLWVYAELRMDPETGMRHRDFNRLLNLGPYGRHLARGYAHERFRHWRSYGRGYVLTPGIIVPGSSAEAVYAVLGPPDRHESGHDIWWMSRDRTGQKMLVEEEPFRTMEWNRRMVAEYDAEGNLERVFIPRDGGVDDRGYPERSPPMDEAPPPVEVQISK